MSAEWETLCLGELADIVGGGTPSRGESSYFAGNIPWLTPSDLAPIGEVRTLGPAVESITEAGLRNSSARLLPQGTVLFSSRASIGKIAVSDRQCTTNQGFSNFIPKEGMVDPWFLAYLLAAQTKEITELAGETTFKEVSKGKLREYEVRLPRDLKEQRRIVARIRELMDRIDEINRMRAAANSQANALPAAVLGYVERTLPAKRVPLAQLVIDSRNGRSVKSSGDTGNGYVLTLSAVRSPIADLKQRKAIVLDEATAVRFAVRPGDVFVGRSNTVDLVGLTAIVEQSEQSRLIFPDLLIRLRPNEDRVRAKYLVYALRFPDSRKQIKERALGSSQSMVKISGERLREVTVPVPGLAEQDRLVARMDTLFKTTADLRERLRAESVRDALLPAAVLRKAFAGEL